MPWGELKGMEGCVQNIGVDLGRLDLRVLPLELGSLSLSFFICKVGRVPSPATLPG